MTRLYGPAAFDAAPYVDAFIAGYPEPRCEDRVMIFLQGAFDDSGSDPTSPIFVLAGFVANAGQWRRFAKAWQTKLAADPAIEYFKMSEAMDGRGQFVGWPEPLRGQKILDLGEIIKDHIELRVDCAIERSDFDELIAGVVKEKEFDSPYFLLFYQLVMTLNTFHRRLGRTDVDVDYIFDDQGAIGARAALWWDLMKNTVQPDRAALFGNPPTFRDDRRFLPLQAADLYAWLMGDRLVLPLKEQKPVIKALHFQMRDTLMLRRHLTREDVTYIRELLLALNERAGL
jgi:hypothetical protein